MRGLYVHIPFCKNKCPYCDFNSYAGKKDIFDEYIARLIKEAKKFRNEKIGTIYLGGGTPSVLSGEQISVLLGNLLNIFDVERDAEIIIEVNPGTVTKDKLKTFFSAGINRLSVGVQSFNDDMLKILGRIHTASQAEDVIKTAQDVGFENISADFMFSYQGQTEKIWLEDVEKACKSGVKHISCYGLKVEKNTPFFRSGMKNLPEETDRKMQQAAVRLLEENGFMRYEISNFAKKGYESRHNLIYWHCGEYIGLGAGAHSYYQGERYSNILSPEEYILSENASVGREKIGDEDKRVEKLIMGMRLSEGTNESLVSDKKALKKYISLGYIKKSGENIAFTDKGFDISNYILSDLI